MLYPVIGVTFLFVFVQVGRGRMPRMVAVPFAINLVANLSFTPIQFGLRNLPLAAVDILVIWGTLVWMMMAVWRHSPWVAVAQGPYFVWVSIATVLQLSMTWMNQPSGRNRWVPSPLSSSHDGSSMERQYPDWRR